MTNTEIPRDQFLQEVIDRAEKHVIAKFHWKGLLTNDRNNVIEIPLKGIKGCHYEIGLRLDCHEIALHFQGSRQHNASRLDGFRPYASEISSKIGHPIRLERLENQDWKRLWIKRPLQPFTHELAEEYGDLLGVLIIHTYPILRSILDNELDT